MKLKVTCTDINCPERTGGVCYMTKPDSSKKRKMPKPMQPTPNLGKWEEHLFEMICKYNRESIKVMFIDTVMHKKLEKFVKTQISLAKQQGYAEGKAYIGKTKREWYQKGYAEGEQQALTDLLKNIPNGLQFSSGNIKEIITKFKNLNRKTQGKMKRLEDL